MNLKGDGPWRLRFQPLESWLVSDPVSGIPHASASGTYTARYFMPPNQDVVVVRRIDLGQKWQWRITDRRKR